MQFAGNGSTDLGFWADSYTSSWTHSHIPAIKSESPQLTGHRSIESGKIRNTEQGGVERDKQSYSDREQDTLYSERHAMLIEIIGDMMVLNEGDNALR